jgi:hypothetical protein
VLKFSEVYEKQVRVVSERPDGSEYINFQKAYDTRECLLNPHYIVSVHPYEFGASSDVNKLAARFPDGTQFSVLVLDGNSFRTSEMIVVGSFDKSCRTLQESSP